MYFDELFRSFRPLHNPLGFGVADFVLLAAALFGAAVILLRAAISAHLAQIIKRIPVAMAILALLAVALRLLLLHSSPVPAAGGADDFSYLLSADTLRHFRLANAPHPFSQFFEAVFVLQRPTYSSIYPLGQGLVLAAGRLSLGSFWAGVLLSLGVFAALCYWMLRGWTSPQWAFLGGILAVMQFGPLNSWTNSYWGGFVSGIAGCLVFGALPRLPARRAALLLGLGLGLQVLSRPFECAFLLMSVALYSVFTKRTPGRWALIGFVPAILLTGLQDRAVTGSWLTMPYMLSRYQYGVPTTFTFQANPVPHRPLTPEQELDYRAQSAIHGPGTDSVGSFFQRLGYRVRFFRFFWLAPLYLGAPFFRMREGWWVVGTILLFFVGTNFYPYFFPHYVAAIACLLLLVGVKGLENLAALRLKGFAWGAMAAGAIVLVCGIHFLFWYGLRASGSQNLFPATGYEAWDYVNTGDPAGRLAVRQALAREPGRKLVFVRYSAGHRFAEWVGNAADIDASDIVWARDLGASEDEKLMHYFPARRAWVLEPDVRPPKIEPYKEQPIH